MKDFIFIRHARTHVRIRARMHSQTSCCVTSVRQQQEQLKLNQNKIIPNCDKHRNLLTLFFVHRRYRRLKLFREKDNTNRDGSVYIPFRMVNISVSVQIETVLSRPRTSISQWLPQVLPQTFTSYSV